EIHSCVLCASVCDKLETQLGSQCGFRSHGFAEVIEGHAKSRIEKNLRLPAEQRSGLGDIGPALLGIVLGKFVEANLALGARDRDYASRAFENSELVGVADIHRKMFVGLRQAQKSFYFITDVTEAAGLRAVAVHG